ncbi:hypothetical protein [Streptomyces sp. V3I7]|uniref:hypothetical protein n=1 Tax=Streptomyces sp. V3I7 TaxID=3042278 RepID=UPI00278855B5|nr:hypothetical protein [Streptomyces sp. V3I7]MDQ0992566.1 hypothetical protein [Streptomyces sp. V3I7]
MLRHEFQPGRLVAGLSLTGTGALYAGAASGLWDVPWFTAVPLVVGGLFLAGATGLVARGIRRGRRGAGRTDAAGDTAGDATGADAPG